MTPELPVARGRINRLARHYLAVPLGDPVARLREWSWRGPTDLPREVARSGPGGAAALARELRNRTIWLERLLLAAALGDATGEAGIEELRVTARVTGPKSVDLRCASVLALAKRLHQAATPDLIASLADRDRSVRGYALVGLAAWGDSSARDAVMQELNHRLKRPSKRRGHPPPEAVAVCYLVRVSNAEQLVDVASALRATWASLSPEAREGVSTFWPDLLGRPDDRRVRAWFLGECGRLVSQIRS